MSGLATFLAQTTSEALVYNRDGIVGTWQLPPATATPTNLNLEDPNNLERWEPWVRASIINFELVSRLGFTADGATASPRRMHIWHLEPGGSANPPIVAYQPLIDLTRPSDAQFREQLNFVAAYSDLRPDRAAEILSQMGGAVAFLSSIPFVHPDRTPWTLQLIESALRLANYVEMRLKHALASRRPHEYSPQIQPMILTPSHSSYPSGHATEAFLSALVLWRLLIDSGIEPYTTDKVKWGDQFMRLAARVAINRTVAGVHFPVDSAAGATLGLTLGDYFVARCSRLSSYTAWRFDGTKFPVPPGNPPQSPPLDGDFYWHSLYDVAAQQQTEAGLASGKFATKLGTQSIAPPPVGSATVLTKLWDKAKAEWT